MAQHDATQDRVVTVSVTVSNTGPTVGSAVTVQVYCSYLDSPKVRVMRYAHMLCGFTKVFLQPSSTMTATVPVSLRTLARWDPDGAAVNLKGTPQRPLFVPELDSNQKRLCVCGQGSLCAVATWLTQVCTRWLWATAVGRGVLLG